MKEFLNSASMQLFFVNSCNRTGSSAFRLSWAASFCMSLLKIMLWVEWNFKIIVILITLLLLLTALHAVNNSAIWFHWEHCNTVHQEMVIQPGLKALHEAEHPKSYVLFRGCLQPHLWQQCSWCSLEILPSSPPPTDWFGCQSRFGALEFTSLWRTQNWDLGSGCAPGALQLWMVTWVHSSAFFQAAWNHLPMCWGCLEL